MRFGPNVVEHAPFSIPMIGNTATGYVHRAHAGGRRRVPSHVFRGRDRSRGRRSACGFARPFAPWRLCRGRCGGRRRNIGERRGRRRTCGRRRGWECRCGCIRAVRVRCARAAAVGVPARHPPLQLELHRLLLGGGRPQCAARSYAGRAAGHHRRPGRCRLPACGYFRWRALPARRLGRHRRLRARARHRLRWTCSPTARPSRRRSSTAIAPYVGRVSVSFDGPNAEAAPVIRREPLFDRLVAAVEMIREAGIAAPHHPDGPWRATSMPWSEYVALADSLGATMNFSLLSAPVESDELAAVLPDDAALERLAQATLALSRDGVPVLVRHAGEHERLTTTCGCGAGCAMVSVSADGEVFPCHMMHDAVFQPGLACGRPRAA